jgi:DeoR family ulaG and ulaABCDEF operon transcriptional repressor
LLRQVEKLVVLVDGSKFAVNGSLVVCPLARIDTLIIDPPAPLAMLSEAGVKVVVASP